MGLSSKDAITTDTSISTTTDNNEIELIIFTKETILLFLNLIIFINFI